MDLYDNFTVYKKTLFPQKRIIVYKTTDHPVRPVLFHIPGEPVNTFFLDPKPRFRYPRFAAPVAAGGNMRGKGEMGLEAETIRVLNLVPRIRVPKSLKLTGKNGQEIDTDSLKKISLGVLIQRLNDRIRYAKRKRRLAGLKRSNTKLERMIPGWGDIGKGWTFRALSEVMGVKVMTVSAWIHGRREMGFTDGLRLAKILQLTPYRLHAFLQRQRKIQAAMGVKIADRMKRRKVRSPETVRAELEPPTVPDSASDVRVPEELLYPPF